MNQVFTIRPIGAMPQRAQQHAQRATDSNQQHTAKQQTRGGCMARWIQFRTHTTSHTSRFAPHSVSRPVVRALVCSVYTAVYTISIMSVLCLSSCIVIADGVWIGRTVDCQDAADLDKLVTITVTNNTAFIETTLGLTGSILENIENIEDAECIGNNIPLKSDQGDLQFDSTVVCNDGTETGEEVTVDYVVNLDFDAKTDLQSGLIAANNQKHIAGCKIEMTR